MPNVWERLRLRKSSKQHTTGLTLEMISKWLGFDASNYRHMKLSPLGSLQALAVSALLSHTTSFRPTYLSQSLAQFFLISHVFSRNRKVKILRISSSGSPLLSSQSSLSRVSSLLFSPKSLLIFWTGIQYKKRFHREKWDVFRNLYKYKKVFNVFSSLGLALKSEISAPFSQKRKHEISVETFKNDRNSLALDLCVLCALLCQCFQCLQCCYAMPVLRLPSHHFFIYIPSLGINFKFSLRSSLAL